MEKENMANSGNVPENDTAPIIPMVVSISINPMVINRNLPDMEPEAHREAEGQ